MTVDKLTPVLQPSSITIIYNSLEQVHSDCIFQEKFPRKDLPIIALTKVQVIIFFLAHMLFTLFSYTLYLLLALARFVFKIQLSGASHQIFGVEVELDSWLKLNSEGIINPRGFLGATCRFATELQTNIYE